MKAPFAARAIADVKTIQITASDRPPSGCHESRQRVVSALSFALNPRSPSAPLEEGLKLFDLTEDRETTLPSARSPIEPFPARSSCHSAAWPGIRLDRRHHPRRDFERLDEVSPARRRTAAIPTNEMKYNLRWSTTA